MHSFMRLLRHTAACLLAAASTLLAQQRPGENVWIEDHTPAVRDLQRIQKLEKDPNRDPDPLSRMKDYQDLLERPTVDGLLPVIPDEPGKPFALFVGVREACRQGVTRLARRSEYRSVYDGRALALWEKALRKGDLAELRDVATKYDASSYGDDILLSIAELSIEQGDYEGAFVALAPIVRTPQAYDISLPQLRVALFRYAQCARALGRHEDLAALDRAATGGEAFHALLAALCGIAGVPSDLLLARHRAVFDAPLAVGSSRTTLREAIHRMAASRVAPAAALGAIASDAPWTFAIPPVSMRPAGGNPGRQLFVRGAAPTVQLLLWDPSIEAGFSPACGATLVAPWLFFHNGCDGVVLDSRTGKPAPWEWSTGDLLPASDEVGKGRISRRACVHGGALYATLESASGRPAAQANDDNAAEIIKCSLYAFDLAREGYRLWDTERPAGRKDDVEFLSEATILSPPASDGAGVYVGAGILKSDLRLYACALDARTGELRWKTFLGAVPTVATQTARADVPQRFCPGLAPVVIGGTVVYCSNWGVVAALDAGNGELKWLVKYNRKRGTPAPGDLADWAENPIDVREGRVIVAPQDSDYLFSLELATGRPFGDKPFERVSDRMQFRWFAALSGGRIAIVSDQKVRIADADDPAHKIADVKLEEPAIGRPCVDGDVLYIPGAKALYRIGLADRTSRELLRWPEKALGGVELARVEGGLVALTRERVYGYVR